MRIKVCGNTELSQVHELDEIGVQYAGFIFYDKSPRYVVNRIDAEGLRKAKLHLEKVGVFVNAGYDEVMRQVEGYGLQLVQLHGDESPELCKRINAQVQTIKVFRVGKTDRIGEKIAAYDKISDFFLFDTDWIHFGGSGEKFNWQLLNGVSLHTTFFLSGGIGLEDAEALQSFISEQQNEFFYAVDVNSRFETKPGVKDMNKIRRFAEVLK